MVNLNNKIKRNLQKGTTITNFNLMILERRKNKGD